MKRIFIAIVIISFLGCKQSETEDLSVTTITNSKLIDVFKASKGDYPNISVHRGGKGLARYPENCLETLQYISDSISAVYEIDVAQTKDGQLILMHDNSIDRTTNGSGSVKKLTYKELSKFFLVDDYNTVTAFKIPLFSDVLNWCKTNNVILTVDIKRSVSQEVVIKAIRDAKAEDITIIITYNVSQAQSAYKLAPDLLLSVSARNDKEFNRLLETKIPTQNMLAFTGTRLSDASLYERLHKEDMVCMLGTLGNLDRQAEARGDNLYNKWKNLGVDILATDRPFAAYNTIN
ncbi:glycerophosphodiester phosphodiesterase family protein [Winogradskyella sp. UBA3174]|uniref:glycerophosphodiester phosphodiesterase family protein n=1 Tax=Winogradskyella sp. UBA3174 TaxID=1947785 RepID=UPI0026010595|nr:glycerophosphodiester phosphodiesterase family protein [Winogradskyella sp. UBA3174]|tara:strand:- start:19173 stop:20045 length:873 start_codon:yes stop_codon:yes gene_type:complete